MKINKIIINHPELGHIIVNSMVLDEISEQICDVVDDFSKWPCYYHAKITDNNDSTFSIEDLMVIKPETINIGWMDNSKACKSYITVVKHSKASNDLIVYPNSILSIIKF